MTAGPQRRTPPVVKDETPETRAGGPQGEAPRGKAAREAKLASALRANLLRRKAAAGPADRADRNDEG